MSIFRVTRFSVLLCSLIALSFSTQLKADGPIRLNFGVYSSNKPSAMVKVFKPALKELEESMSKKLDREVDIRMQIAKDYDQGISHLVNGRVDFSRFGPASYVEAKRMNKGISILAVENVKNSKVFYGIIAVRKDSPINSIEELKGKSFAFGDEGSTIGRFLSQLELEQAGIRAGDLSRYEYLGRHDKVGTAVGAGDFDAGALNEKTFKKLVKAGENIRELVRFPNVTKPWIARSDLDPHVFEALRQSLLEITNPQTLSTMKIDGFLEGSDDDYRVIRKAMDNNQAFFSDPVDIDIVAPSAKVSIPSNVAEPVLQAASVATGADTVVKPTASVELSNNATSKLAMEQTSDHYNSAGRHITVNITLPPSLYIAGAYSGPSNLTINLSIPDPEIDDSITDDIAATD